MMKLSECERPINLKSSRYWRKKRTVKGCALYLGGRWVCVASHLERRGTIQRSGNSGVLPGKHCKLEWYKNTGNWNTWKHWILEWYISALQTGIFWKYWKPEWCEICKLKFSENCKLKSFENNLNWNDLKTANWNDLKTLETGMASENNGN